MQSSHGYVMPCSTWLTKRMHRWKLLIIRLRLWEVRTVDSIASSYFQCFGQSVGQYQGLPPHSDEYKTLEKSWLSYACHAMREGLPGFWSLPYLSPAIQNAVPELAPSQQTASTERIDPRLPCSCGKGATSYPHWPPSCHEEAVDQLRCLLEAQPHRLGNFANGTQNKLPVSSCDRPNS